MFLDIGVVVGSLIEVFPINIFVKKDNDTRLLVLKLNLIEPPIEIRAIQKTFFILILIMDDKIVLKSTFINVNSNIVRSVHVDLIL